MIKAIIFDFGGVIVEDRYTKSVTDQSPEFKKAEKSANAGKKVQGEILILVNKLTPNTPTAYASPDPEIIKLIGDLKLKYKVGLLSNNFAVWTKIAKRQSYMSLFDDAVFSSDVGLAKPDAKIYLLIIEKLGVLPEECVFIDNQPENVDGAIKVGMTAFLYTNVDKLKEDLGKI